MNRRTFISSLAVASAALATRSRVFGAASPAPAKVGVIGCGWFGGIGLESMARQGGVEFVSLCDVNANHLAKTLQTVAKYQSAAPRTFANFRDMLGSQRHDIVIVATPDHWHALPALEAIQAGADVWLEKPVGVDVIEGEALVAAARKHQRVVQVNTQRRSAPFLATARDRYLRSGKLGPIGVVEAYCYLHNRPADVPPPTAAPAHLDYELWSGPAPLLPFRAPFEDRGWRAFMEYGNGVVGDMGVHMIDTVRWMLGLGWPESVHSTGGIYVDTQSPSNISDTLHTVFRYPQLDLSWEHRTWGDSPLPQRHWTDQWGARFVGKHGTLKITTLGYEFIPAGGGPPEGMHLCSKTGDLENLDFSDWFTRMLEAGDLHMRNFLAARESRARPVADIEEGHISSACCVLANLSQELGRPLSYDRKTRTIPGDAEATSRLARPYRGPWTHPDPAAI